MNAPLQTVRIDCRNAMTHLVANLEGQLAPDLANDLHAHLQGCPRCAQAAEQFQQVHLQLNSTVGARRVSQDFAERSNRRLVQRSEALKTAGATSEQLSAVGLGVDDEDDFLAPPVTFLDALQARMGGAPWWVISGAFHGLLLMLLGLIGMAVMRAQQEDTVIVTNLEQRKEPDEPDKPIERDVFKKPVPVETTEPTLVESPVVTHEEVEVADHVETQDDMDMQNARGDENAISDVPLGGVGTVAAIGLGGGGGGAFGHRSGGGRKRLAMRGGGGKATESAVDAALRWLARHQSPDGHWDTVKHEGSGGDTACTGLALLAFLGAGHTEKIGKYKDNVQLAVKWLIAQQDAEGKILKPGETHGRIGYNHSIAGLALAEAAGMGRQQATIEAAQKAVDYSVNVMQRGDQSEKMGWRYSPKQLGDTSVGGWFIMQLKSAKVSGLNVDPAAFEGADKFLDSVMTEAPSKDDPYSGHKYGYIKDGRGPNGIRIKSPHNNTAIGILCRQFLGYPQADLEGGVKYFVEKGGNPTADHAEFYYWYYGTLCTFQQGGDIWKTWNEGLKGALLQMQRKGGDEDGSWDPKGHSVEGAERVGGRVFTTAMGALCLEVYYRYLPIYK